MNITKPVCVSVALVIQHAMRMRHIICHLWTARLYYIFPHYLKKHDLKKKVTEYKMCVLVFSTAFV